MSGGRRLRAARLVPTATLSWAAAAAAVLFPDAAGAMVAVGWSITCLGMLTLALARGRRRTSVLAVVLVVACAGGAAAATSVALAEPSRTAVAEVLSGTRAVEVVATVAGRVGPGPSGDAWFDVMLERVETGGRALRTSVPARIGVAAADVHTLAGVDLGARIRVRGLAFEPDPGERAVAVVRAAGGVELLEAPAGIWAVLAQVRAGLAASAATLPGPGAALVPGLAVGDTSAVGAELDGSMKAASLSHLTAVSGANCAIVVGLAFGVAAWCGARRGVRVAVGLVALAVFVLLVTPEPSVVRAGAMATIAMLAVALGRTGAGVSVLSLAVTVLLVVDPWLAHSLGFALSTVATAALLVLARPLATGLSRLMPRPLALGISVPLAAQLACAPLLVIVDPRVPLLGVMANMLAAPAAPLATIAGFLACLFGAVPVVQDGLVAVAWLPASWIAGVAEMIARIPAQSLEWTEGLPGVASLALVCACIAVAIAAPRGGRRWVGMLRAVAIAVVAIVVAAGAGTTVLRTVGGGWTVPSAWQIAMCDVGQGDAILVHSAGRVALFDTGPDPEPLRVCLQQFGIERVDLLVLTHFDLDHIGGVDAVIGRAGVVLHGPTDGAAARRLLAGLADGGARLEQVAAGDGGTLGAARWQVLWPAASFDLPGNDASVVLDIEGPDVPRTLLLGDLSEEPLVRLRAAVAAGGYRVVNIAHHKRGVSIARPRGRSAERARDVPASRVRALRSRRRRGCRSRAPPGGIRG